MQQLILGSFAGEWFEAQDEAQARLLTDPTSRGLLAPFIGAERSASRAAQEAGCSIQRMLYRVAQFQRAGLLRETRQERRSGRPVRYYRAVADGFYVPFEVTPFADVEALLTRQSAPFDRLRDRAAARRARQRAGAGRRIYRDALSGELHSESALDAGTSPAVPSGLGNDVVLTLRLTDEAAHGFTAELADFYRRLEAARLPEGHGQSYLVHFGLLPLTAEDGTA